MSCENCERLKDTNRRLNRRCQSAEAGLAAKISDYADTSFGRTLANAAATMYREQAEEAGLEIARLRAEVGRVRQLHAEHCAYVSCSEPHLTDATKEQKGETNG